MIVRRIAFATLVAVLATAVSASASIASPVDGARSSARAGGGSGSGGSTALPATLTASPNPVAAWSQYWLSGCGYVTGKQVTIVIDMGTFFSAAVDARGCLTPVSWWTSGPGTYRVEGYQQLRSRKQTLMSATTVTAF